MRLILSCLILWCIALSTPAAVVELHQPSAPVQGKISLKEHIGVLQDPGSQLEFSVVSSAAMRDQFRTGFRASDSLDYGFSKAAYWVRIPLKNSGSKPVQQLLELDNPTLGQVWSYIPDSRGTYQVTRTGAAAPYASRAYPNRHFVFPLEVPAGETREIYLRVQSVNTVVLSLNLWSPPAFQRHERNDYMVQVLFTGVMLGLILYNALLWLTLRISVYGYYVLYALLMALSINTITGVIGEVFQVESARLQDLAYSTGFALASACFFQFLRLMLEMKDRLPTVNLLMHAGSIFYLLAPIPYYLYFDTFIGIYIKSFLVTTVFGLGVLVYDTTKGVSGARQVFLGYICLAGGALLHTLTSMNLLPARFATQNGLLVGASLEMVFLALALASRFNAMRRENARAQTRALKAEKQLVDELRKSERNLEEKIELRTQALLATQKELETAKEKAEAGTRAKSEFLATMSHEIRTPLHAIVGMTYLLLHTQLDEKARNYATKISGAATNLQIILDDILDFSRLEANKLELEDINFSISDLFEQTSDLFASRAAAKNIALRFSLAPQLPACVIGDPVRIGQILTNLVGNALKFTRQGTILVGVDVVHQSFSHAELRFRVQDTGIGISPEQCDLIFQPFSQADSTVTRKYGGSGLGLAICKRLLDLMDGRIWVQSREGVGSVFYFQLTLGVPDADASPTTEPQRLLPDLSDTQGLRILLVEDDPLNLEMTRDLLTETGMLVDVARDGREALSALATHTFDLVLMDCQMPVLDGFSATREIRRNPAWTELPILAITANANTETVDKALAAGMNAVIPKPINPQSALRTITSLARRETGQR